jgi:hypothetical protein
MMITREFLSSGAIAGLAGWNPRQMALIGVSFPAPRNWIDGVVGKVIDDDVAAEFVALRGVRVAREALKPRRRKRSNRKPLARGKIVRVRRVWFRGVGMVRAQGKRRRR